MTVPCFSFADTIDTSVVLEEHDVGQSDRVRIVSRASTSYEGRGKLVFKVRRGKAYRLRIVQPYGVTGQCDLPSAKEGGMSIRSLVSKETKYFFTI